MKKYRITYFISPHPNIIINIVAKDYDDAVIYAKNYRRDSFSIEEIE